MPVSSKIGKVLSGQSSGSDDSRLGFFEEYHKNFLESGAHKGRAALNQIQSLSHVPFLDRLAYVSIGGSSGSEIEYVLANSAINHGVLLEVDTYSCQQAQERMRLLPKGKQCVIIPGDAVTQLPTAQNVLKKLKDSGQIDGVLISVNAVFHELPFRSKGFDLNSFLGELFWDWNPCLFVCREPCTPCNWPERVDISVKGISSEELLRFSQEIKRRLSIPGEINRCGHEYVSMPSVLATETIHKLFYIDDYHHEIEERLTYLEPNSFVRLVEKYLGKNSVFETRLNSSSFSRKYQEFGVNAQDATGLHLPMPLSFFSIVASRVN